MLSLFCARKGNSSLTPIQYVNCLRHEYFSHSHASIGFVLPPFFLLFSICYTYDIMKPAFLSVPAAVVHCFTEHTIIYTSEFCPMPERL